LSAAQLVNPETRLPTDRSRALAKRIFAELGDPEAGLRVAERFRPEDADLVGYLARNSTNALEALQTFPRYARLIGDSAVCSVEVLESTVEVSFGLSGGRKLLPQAVDYAVSVFVRAAREATFGRLRLLEARLSRPRPRRLEAYRRALCPSLGFDSEQCALVFSKPELETPFAHGNPRLRALLAKQADDVLSRLPEATSIDVRVRANVARRLADGLVGIDAIARDLGMSERTLRRRLRDAGHTYRELLDAVRSERAMALADQGGHSVTTIAQLSGFADATTFARAFRRWTGCAPNVYLRRAGR